MNAIAKRQQDILQVEAGTPEELLQRVRAGLPATTIRKLVELGFDRRAVFSIVGSRTTLERRLKRKQALSTEESDRLARMAAVLALAEAVFGDTAKAMHWLQRESVDLAGQGAPISLLTTSQGTDLVKERLEQIRHGIYA